MIWFSDTQKWNLALETDKAGKVITGRKENLINAIRNGSAVRCVTSDGTYAFPAENIAIDSTSTNVAAQTLNHIGRRIVCVSLYLLTFQISKSRVLMNYLTKKKQKKIRKSRRFYIYNVFNVLTISYSIRSKGKLTCHR